MLHAGLGFVSASRQSASCALASKHASFNSPIESGSAVSVPAIVLNDTHLQCTLPAMTAPMVRPLRLDFGMDATQCNYLQCLSTALQHPPVVEEFVVYDPRSVWLMGISPQGGAITMCSIADPHKCMLTQVLVARSTLQCPQHAQHLRKPLQLWCANLSLQPSGACIRSPG